MLNIYVNTNYINIPPIKVVPGEHAISFYLIKHNQKNYVYYKCTVKLNEIAKDRQLKLKKIMKEPVTFKPYPEIAKMIDKKIKGKPILILKNVAFETIDELLKYCLV